MVDTIRGSKELLLVVDRLASDKGINPDSIIKAMEDGIKMAARRKYGHDLNVECIIDKKTGDISLYNILNVVPDDYNEEDMDYKKQIRLSDAVEKISNDKALFQESVNVGETIKLRLPSIDLSRVVVQIAKNEIIKKIKEAEKEREYNDFIG